MKVLMNTNYQSAGMQICMDETVPRFVMAGHEVARNDWNNYQNYDLILFMSPDSEVRKAKAENPNATVGILDSKITKNRLPEIKAADFLFATSLEQKEALSKYNKNIFTYYSFSEIKPDEKDHNDKEKIIIGYHGNQSHLVCMSEVVKALDKLSEKYDIELWAIYNIKKWGKWSKGVPRKTKVRHIQWSERDYREYLLKTDIGIVPSKTPINETLGKIASTSFLKKILGYNLKYNKLDYLMRFKYSTNPGRIYAFSQLGVPVVADFTPSNCQIIKDGLSGLLAWSMHGWYDALEKLIKSADLRNKMADNLREYIDNNCSPDINFRKFLDFLEKIKK